MKSTLIEKNAKKEQEYPFLGIAEDGDVVLFSSPSTGTVVLAVSGVHDLGEWDDCWAMLCFTPFEGSVLLES